MPISGPPLGINTIYQMGLVLSKFSFGEDDYNPTFQPGLFRLELAEIGTCKWQKGAGEEGEKRCSVSACRVQMRWLPAKRQRNLSFQSSPQAFTDA